MAAAERVKNGDGENDLLERIRTDDAFSAVRGSLDEVAAPERFVGRAPEQVEEFLSEVVDPALDALGDMEEQSADLKV